MIKHGPSYGDFIYPALDTFKILWGRDPEDASGLSSENIGPLVDKTITYLQGLSPTIWRDGHLLPYETKDIPQYLNVHIGDNSVGNLCRYLKKDTHGTLWQCRHHSRRCASDEGLCQLLDFIREHGGHVDMVQAAVRANLASEREANEFIDRLSSSQHIFGVHVNLGWGVQRSFLESFALKVASTGARSLEVEGVIPENYRLHHIEHGRSPFADAINSERLGIIKLLNYPRPLAQHAFISEATTYYGLQFEQSPTGDDINWLTVIDELKGFWK